MPWGGERSRPGEAVARYVPSDAGCICGQSRKLLRTGDNFGKSKQQEQMGVVIIAVFGRGQSGPAVEFIEKSMYGGASQGLMEP